jgi:hypothetical protein
MSEQLQKLRKDQLAKAKKEAADRKEGSPAPALVARRPSLRAAAPAADDGDELGRAKALLESKQRAITELEADRQHRVLSLRGKLGELLAEYTPAHPQVLDAQRTLDSLSQESPQVTNLRGEVKELETELRRRTVSAKLIDGASEFGGLPSLLPPSTADPLPTEIVTLANDDDLDPAVTAQFRYSVTDYTRLRDAISSARVELDTAQAAFSHRYKIVVPPEAPGKPAKPKIPLVLGAGIAAAIFLGAIAAILAELATGKMIERWQVNQIELPVLAELRFPPASEKN